MSAAVAHADPSFVLAESQARAGDAVHFSITGGEDRVTYELEVADRDVLKGEGDGDSGAVSGQFTMPDLGATAKSVTVEAVIRDDGDDKTTVKRKLQYLGPALAAVAPAEPQSVAAPAAPQQPASRPAPAHSPATGKAQTTEPPAAERKAKRKRKRARKRRAAEHRRDTSSQSRSEKRSPSAKPAKEKTRRKRHAPRSAPLFDGVPEADSGGFSAGDYEESESKAPSTKPPAAVYTAPAANVGDEPAKEILVPGLLGLAGFILAGFVILRQRRRH